MYISLFLSLSLCLSQCVCTAPVLGVVWRTTGRPRLLAGDTFTSPVTFTAVGQSVFKAMQSIMRNALSLMADECVTAPDSAALLGMELG